MVFLSAWYYTFVYLFVSLTRTWALWRRTSSCSPVCAQRWDQCLARTSSHSLVEWVSTSPLPLLSWAHTYPPRSPSAFLVGHLLWDVAPACPSSLILHAPSRIPRLNCFKKSKPCPLALVTHSSLPWPPTHPLSPNYPSHFLFFLRRGRDFFFFKKEVGSHSRGDQQVFRKGTQVRAGIAILMAGNSGRISVLLSWEFLLPFLVLFFFLATRHRM